TLAYEKNTASTWNDFVYTSSYRPMQKKNRLRTETIQGGCRKRTGGCRGYSEEGASDSGSKAEADVVALSVTVKVGQSMP
ncbi:MAG: hypothetical protein J5855_02415, partial [Mailhella sp.]|nr:hypothetical protein [Mailhella sp.]